MKVYLKSLAGWTPDGLDHQETGERRWGFNIAKLLAKAGHDVTIAQAIMLGGENTIAPYNIKITADAKLSDLDASDFQAVVLPGGMPGAMNLRNSDELMKFTCSLYANGGIVAAICAAPIALAKFGLLEGKKITAYPGFEEYLNGNAPTGRMTESDDRIVTGKGVGAAFEFATRIAEALGKGDRVKKVFDGMFVEVT